MMTTTNIRMSLMKNGPNSLRIYKRRSMNKLIDSRQPLLQKLKIWNLHLLPINYGMQ